MKVKIELKGLENKITGSILVKQSLLKISGDHEKIPTDEKNNMRLTGDNENTEGSTNDNKVYP